MAGFEGRASASLEVASLFSPRENMAMEVCSIFSMLEKPILHRERESLLHRPKEAHERDHCVCAVRRKERPRGNFHQV